MHNLSLIEFEIPFSKNKPEPTKIAATLRNGCFFAIVRADAIAFEEKL